MANAVQHVGQSVKIWLAAADLEHDPAARKRVPRKGKSLIGLGLRISTHCFSTQLSNIFPTQFDYGKKLSTGNLPPLMLGFFSLAVEVIPLSVELAWPALARLEVPERAKAILNKACKAVPSTSHEISWKMKIDLIRGLEMRRVLKQRE